VSIHRAAFEREYPRMRSVIRRYLARVADRARREDFEADAVGVAWMHWQRLADRGRAPQEIAGAIAKHAAQWALRGRSVIQASSVKDAMTDPRQYRGTFRAQVQGAELMAGVELDGEKDGADRRASVWLQVAMRLDFWAWFDSLTFPLDDIASYLMDGVSARDIAANYERSEAWVVMQRRKLRESWEAYTR
jgi:hypothetical protein